MNEFYDNWRKPEKVASDKPELVSGLDIDTVRNEMALQIEKHLVTGENGMLIVNVPCGVGKSYTAKYVTENIAEITGQKIAWFGSRHNGYGSLERDGEWTQIYGRHGDQTNKDGDIIEIGNCDFDKHCQHVLRKGHSPAVVVCSPKDENKRKPNVWKCPIPRENCDYWMQWEQKTHWYLTSNFIPACKLWSASNDIVILDEVDSYDLVPDPVDVNAKTIDTWIEKYPAAKGPLLAIRNMIIDGVVSDTELQEALSNALGTLGLWLLVDIEDSIPDEFEVSTLNDIEALPDNRCKEFLQTVRQEVIAYRNGNPVVSRIVAHPDKFVFYPKLDLSKPFIDVHNENKTLTELPSVLLNASCNVAGLSHLLANEDYKISAYNPFVALHSECQAIYDISRNNSKFSVNNRQQYYDRWINQIKDYVGSTKVLVIATMDGERLLTNGLRDLIQAGLVELAHYGNVSGLNRFEDCEQVILAQPFQPAPIAVAERYRQIYGGTEGRALDLSTCYKQVRIDTGNIAYNVSVRTMKDSRLRPIYEAWRNSEHYQALHRVRPILHKRKIIVLFAIPIDELGATEIIYNPTRSGRKQKIAELEEAAIELLDTKEYFTQADLKECGFSRGYVSQKWEPLRQNLGLQKKNIMIPTNRYPNGRKTEVLYLKIGDEIEYITNGKYEIGKVTSIRNEHFIYIDNVLAPMQSVVSVL